MYAKNCVIDEISPFTFEPKLVIINFGTIKPHNKTIACKNNDVIIFNIAVLLLNFLSYLYIPFFPKFANTCINYFSVF